MAGTGLAPDARQIIARARTEVGPLYKLNESSCDP
jgi:hypothetical protein